jgi:hypothetical protein
VSTTPRRRAKSASAAAASTATCQVSLSASASGIAAPAIAPIAAGPAPSRKMRTAGLARTRSKRAECEELHRAIDRYSYGPPTIRFAEAEVDQARAAGVLIEFERGAPIVCDRSLYRELVRQAIARTVEELRDRKTERDAKRAQTRAAGGERTPAQELEADHRAIMRELTARAHNTNLDLGAGLLQNLAIVDPDSLDVARFFAYGLLGADSDGFYSADDLLCPRLAANGIRLSARRVPHHRDPDAEVGQAGQDEGHLRRRRRRRGVAVEVRRRRQVSRRALRPHPGRSPPSTTPSSSCSRRARARHSVVPSSHDDRARKAFERVCRSALPDTYKQLERAIAREAREHAKRQRELQEAQASHNGDKANLDK